MLYTYTVYLCIYIYYVTFYSAHREVKTSTILTTGGRCNAKIMQSKHEGMYTCTSSSENTLITN